MPFEGDNMMGVKRNNRSATLRILHEKGDMSRKRLAEYMKLTPPAITKIVAEMLQEGLLREGSAVSSGAVGRREILVELNTRAACGLGVLINLRQAILSATWLDGSVIFSEEIVLPPRAPARETVERLAAHMEFTHWGKADIHHTICRFVTSWATTQDELNELKRLL